MKQIDYQDIFEDYEQKDGCIIDISTDEGIWRYLDAIARGFNVSYGFQTGEDSKPRKIRDAISHAERIYIYGAGSSGGRTLKLLRQAGIDIVGFVDSSKARQGTIYNGKRIYEIFEVEPNSCIILSCGKYKDVIKFLNDSIDLCNFSIFIDFANSLFYSKEPIEHIQLVDLLKGNENG